MAARPKSSALGNARAEEREGEQRGRGGGAWWAGVEVREYGGGEGGVRFEGWCSGHGSRDHWVFLRQGSVFWLIDCEWNAEIAVE